MELISKDSLYNKMVKQEELALKRVLDTPITINGKNNPCYLRYSEQHNERSAFKNMIFDEPEVSAIVIPEGATNGNMMKAMFSDSTKYEFAIEDNLKIATMFVNSETSQVFYVHFDLDWWNAPYKGVEND